jgi:hypothetical protein
MTDDQRKPQNAIGLARLSELRFPDLDEDGNAKGAVDQEQRMYARAKQIGWKLTGSSLRTIW